MAKYFIVEFEDGVQLVPRGWMDKNRMKCSFPKYDPVCYNKAIRNEERANPEWKKFPVKRVMGRAENFEEGKIKLRKAEDRSDLDISTDLERERPRKKKCAVRCNEVTVDGFPDTPNKIVQPAIISSSPISALNSSFDSLAQLQPRQINENNVSMEILNTKVTKLQFQLDVIQKTQELILKKLEEIGSNSSSTYKDNTESVQLPKLPLDSIEEIESLEEGLKDADFKNCLVFRLRNLGGKTLSNVVNRQLQHLLTLPLGNKFSFYGTKEKLPFSSLKICSVISDVSRHHMENATDDNVKEAVQTWLRHAKEKMQKKLYISLS